MALLAAALMASCAEGNEGSSADDEVDPTEQRVNDRIGELESEVEELRTSVSALADRVSTLESDGPALGAGVLDAGVIDALCRQYNAVIGFSVTPAMGVIETFVEGYVRFDGDEMELLAIYDDEQGQPNGEVIEAGAIVYRFSTLPPPPDVPYNDDFAQRSATAEDILRWSEYTLVLDGECHAIERSADDPSEFVQLALSVASE